MGLHAARRSFKALGIAAVGVLALALGTLGCGGGVTPEDRTENIKQLWAEFPGFVEWDLEIRGVSAQKMSTGSHDAWHTVYHVTYHSRYVPGFDLFGSIDVPKDDSMEFRNRVEAHFLSTTDWQMDLPPGTDPITFMKWWAATYPDDFFLQIRGENIGSGSPSYFVVASEILPEESWTTVEKFDVPLKLDPATGAWTAE